MAITFLNLFKFQNKNKNNTLFFFDNTKYYCFFKQFLYELIKLLSFIFTSYLHISRYFKTKQVGVKIS